MCLEKEPLTEAATSRRADGAGCRIPDHDPGLTRLRPEPPLDREEPRAGSRW